jgi:hypothetical protein
VEEKARSFQDGFYSAGKFLRQYIAPPIDASSNMRQLSDIQAIMTVNSTLTQR